MNLSLSEKNLKEVYQKISKGNKDYKKIYPGESLERQPVTTVYGGAQLFKSNTTVRIGELALRAYKEYIPNANVLATILGWNQQDDLNEVIYEKIEEKLKREAVEDFRIDFEDGFGIRPDKEEDDTAVNCANEVWKGMQEKTLSPFIGIRVKTLSDELKHRALRTLDIFISTLVSQSGGALPDNFVVTLPKITSEKQVEAFIEALEILEKKLKMKKGSIKMELMVETPQSIFGADGKTALIGFVKACKGRCKAAHFGVYDYTASLDITAKLQAMDHTVCDFARHVMKVTLAGTGVWLSDGATNVMPVGPHRGDLTEEQRQENIDTVNKAWKLGYDHIMHSLNQGFYQGWDLHPAQMPIRYAACYKFFLDGLESASVRLKNFIEKAAQATLVGDIFDDAATGQGLLNYFLRALNCGAISEEEVLKTGLTLEEVRGRSFLKILEGRKKGLNG
ncbi:MAG: phosphoenolpyruvate kinase [Bacteroidetes bacterium]|nr:phosphoenolpyruvate kinase [Bacteroidota bacterium]MBX7046261.1 phosphoenolpyruvate kinase [Ignavibacteria bacterium]